MTISSDFHIIKTCFLLIPCDFSLMKAEVLAETLGHSTKFLERLEHF